MRLSPLLFSLLFTLSAAALADGASAAGSQSTPPPTGQDGGGHDCEHEKKEKQVS